MEENKSQNYYNFSPEMLKDKAFDEAVRKFPKGAFVFLEETNQIGIVEEVRATIDGPRIKVKHIGSVPISEIRLATQEEVENSKSGSRK